MPKNRDVEVLRAIAIAFVIVFHLAPHALARLPGVGGRLADYTGLWSGVDLFFCVSGYVITLSLLRETRPPSFLSFALPFWTRRVLRLWPGAWLWAAVAVALAYSYNSLGLFGSPANTARDAVMAVANLANLHDFQCLREQSCGALRIYWSLSLEEQFYWIFPCLVYGLSRRALGVFLCLAALAQLFLVRPMPFLSAVPSFAWLVRTDAICWGALAALATNSPWHGRLRPFVEGRRSVRIAVVLSLGLLACAAAPALHLARATGILAIASAVLVWIASYDATAILPRWPILEPILLWLGSRSYSLYLVHDIGGALAAQLRAQGTSAGGWAWALLYGVGLTGALILGMAELNFRLLETPLRRYGRALAQRQTAHYRAIDPA